MEAEPVEPAQGASQPPHHAPAPPAAAAAAAAAGTAASASNLPQPTDGAPAGGAASDGAAAAAAAGDAAASTAATAAGSNASGDAKKQSKRKVAMHLAYLGAGYNGMQRNPGARTIESELEAALVRAGAISDANAGSFQKIHWNRAARTDKGVSAVCQVVSAKLLVEPRDTFAARVNAHLPSQIRVFGTQRATEGFDARKFCDKRRYEYVLPAWAFDPQACVQGRPEGQAGGRRPAAPAGAGTAASKPGSAARLADEAAALAAIASAVMTAPSGGDGGGGGAGAAAAAAAGGSDGATGSDGSGRQRGAREPAEPVADELASTSAVGGEEIHRLRREVDVSRQRFVFGQQQLQRLNGLLAQYEGTHNYHNFTVRMPATDPASRRYLLGVKAESVTIGRWPWVRIVIEGQSFMLHQIRKMVGMVLAVMRGVAPEECLALALDADRDLHTPMAPELGLFLDETFYDSYNTRFGELHGPVTFEPYRQAAADFKDTILYPHIAALDDAELVNALWIRGCTEAQYKFSTWASRPKARESTVLNHQPNPNKQQQQGGRGRGGDNKRKQEQSNGAAGAAANAGAAAAGAGACGPQAQQQLQQQQQQQHQAHKQQRLERPGKHDGASAAMVVGVQETYGMHPHSDTPKAAAQRAELKAMRAEHAQVLEQQQQQQRKEQQQQQQQCPEPTAEDIDAELDALYG